MNQLRCGIVLVAVCLVAVATASNGQQSDPATAADLVSRLYSECSSLSCAKPKVLAFVSSSLNKNKIRITRDLSIVRAADVPETVEDAAAEASYKQQIADLSEDAKEALRSSALDKMDDFIATHELRLRVPKELISAPVARFVPELLMKNIPTEIKVPLAGSQVGQERGFVKKVIIPFLLGLKFKATALLPLALALIALKTWKALTLGLLSLVLSGALMMFRFATKPKILSYEVVHAHPPPIFHSAPIAPHYIDHHEHVHDHHGFEHGPFQKRSIESGPYRAYQRR